MQDTLHQQNGTASSARRLLIAAGGTFGVWLLLTGSLQAQELATGAAVAILTAIISAPHLGLLDPGQRLGHSNRAIQALVLLKDEERLIIPPPQFIINGQGDRVRQGHDH